LLGLTNLPTNQVSRRRRIRVIQAHGLFPPGAAAGAPSSSEIVKETVGRGGCPHAVGAAAASAD